MHHLFLQVPCITQKESDNLNQSHQDEDGDEDEFIGVGQGRILVKEKAKIKAPCMSALLQRGGDLLSSLLLIWQILVCIFRLYLYVQHYAFADPPNGEEPCVKVQRHLELQAGQNPLIWEEKKQDRLVHMD